jgi:hypothetical protein
MYLWKHDFSTKNIYSSFQMFPIGLLAYSVVMFVCLPIPHSSLISNGTMVKKLSMKIIPLDRGDHHKDTSVPYA